MVHIILEGLPFPLLDIDGVCPAALPSATNKVHYKHSTELFEGVDQAWLEARVSILGHFFKSGGRSSVENAINSTVEKHENLEAL